MTPKELYDRFRADVVDAVEPFLWSDLEVWGYMTDAQEMLCRLTEGLRDASSEATECEIGNGEPFVDLHPAVLLIRSAKLGSTGRPVHVFSYEEVAGSNPEVPWPCHWGWMDQPGPVRGVIIGMEEGRLRLVQIPQADDTLNLVIERLPLSPLCRTSEQFEVRKEHHLALLLWMKHLAFAKEDSETYDRERSRDKQMEFDAYCAQAKAEKARRNYKPRLIRYGGL